MVIEVSEVLGTFHMCRNRRAGFSFCLTGSQFVLCVASLPAFSFFNWGHHVRTITLLHHQITTITLLYQNIQFLHILWSHHFQILTILVSSNASYV